MQAQKDFNIDFSSSIFIGDTTRDIAVTKDIGGKSILLKCGLGGKDNKFPITPDHYFKNLLDAAKTILKK